MEKMNVLTLIITLVVGVILTGALLGPVINDATKTEQTFVNEGVFNYGIFTPEDEYELEVVGADGSITVNGVAVDPFNATTRYYSIVASDNFVARYGYSNNIYFCQCVGKDSSNNTFADGGVLTNISIDNGALAVQITKSDSTVVSKTVEFTELYAIVPTADEAVMKVATDSVYIKGDSPIYSSGLTQVTLWSNLFHLEGTYNDGLTISSPNLPDATYDNITWNIEPVSGYVDLYKLTSIEFDINNNGTTYHATYAYFGVPAEVTAELSNHLTPGQISLMGAIPVVVIVALLMVAVGAIAYRRAD